MQLSARALQVTLIMPIETRDRQSIASSSRPSQISSGQFGLFKCHLCNRTVNTSQGLKSHITRKHPPSEQAQLLNTEPRPPSPLHSHEESLEILLGKLRRTTKIIRRIPKGARPAAAAALADTIDACLRDQSPHHWDRLLSFAPLCLSLPVSSDKTQTSLTSIVKSNIKDFLSGKLLSSLPVQASSQHTPTTTPSSRSKLIQAKLADGDVRGAVRLLSSDSSFAPVTQATLEALKSQHPAAVVEDSFQLGTDSSTLTPLTVSEPSVRAAISSFPAGSSGGLDLLRPQHLKDMTSHSTGAAGARLLSSLTRLCNLMLAGGVPKSICPVLYGASLCALQKPSGGVRPIAVGSTLRRLTAKLACLHISDRVGSLLQPTQLGFGSKGGIEAATHSARRYVAYDHQTPKVILKVDFNNAFNTLHRDKLLRTVLEVIPELYLFIDQCYSLPSSLVYGEQLITSERGIQQGDPLGPALFSLSTHPMAKELKSELNLWYLDDGALADSPQTVLQDFKAVIVNSSDLGLTLNTSKCELYCLVDNPEIQQDILRSFQEVAPDIQLKPLRTYTQLGSPLFPLAISESLKEKSDTINFISGRLEDIPSHCSFFILKNSQAIPKLTYLLRSTPSWEHPAQLACVDHSLREALSGVLNIQMTQEVWSQSSWPASRGGLGIRHASALALPAFLSSTFATLDLVEKILPDYIFASEDHCLSSGISMWRETSGSLPPTHDLRHVQKEWERPLVDLSILSAMERAPNPQYKARLLSVSAPESGAFLQTLPAASLGTLMSDQEFRISVALRLGAEICQPHICKCGAQVNTFGTHGLSCRQSAGRIIRHSSANEVIKRALASANVPAELEPSHLSLDNNIRPDGITLIPWMRGKSLIWDFTCSDSLAPSYVEHSSEDALYTASIAELHKQAKYESLSSSHIFTPVAVECLGAIGKVGLQFLKTLGKRITATTGEPRATSFLLQRVSIAIQRGNALSVQGSIPVSDSLDGDLNNLAP